MDNQTKIMIIDMATGLVNNFTRENTNYIKHVFNTFLKNHSIKDNVYLLLDTYYPYVVINNKKVRI